jgi:hypothetical protein
VRWSARAKLGQLGGTKTVTALLTHRDPDVAAMAHDLALFWKQHIKGVCGPWERMAALQDRWVGGLRLLLQQRADDPVTLCPALCANPFLSFSSSC